MPLYRFKVKETCWGGAYTYTYNARHPHPREYSYFRTYVPHKTAKCPDNTIQVIVGNPIFDCYSNTCYGGSGDGAMWDCSGIERCTPVFQSAICIKKPNNENLTEKTYEPGYIIPR